MEIVENDTRATAMNAVNSPKPPALLAEDSAIGLRRLEIAADRVRVTPVADVFAK